MTEEQKTLQRKCWPSTTPTRDGKLDKEERAKISAEDKEKIAKSRLTHKKKAE